MGWCEQTPIMLWDWRILDYRGRRIMYHGGNVNQYKTQILIDPENKIGICVLFNAPNPF